MALHVLSLVILNLNIEPVMTLADEDNLFTYSNITFTASYKDIDEQYRFIINRLLIKLNAFIVTKSSSIDVYNVETSGERLIPTPVSYTHLTLPTKRIV